MKKVLTLLLLLAGTFVFAQSVNNYKYVIVPKKFDFQREAGQYELNNLVKMMFEKYGFTVLMQDTQYPDDVALDRCKPLYADIVESGLLHTNLTIVLKDCSDTALFTSAAGRSKEKDRRKAYYEALREAAPSLAGLNYKYTGEGDGKSKTVTRTITNKEEVTVYVESPNSAKTVTNPNQLTAKSTAYGYELVDAKGSHFLKMYKTSQPDSYSAQMESINGVVFKKGNEWFFEYHVDDKPISQKLDIRF
ncbi:MAG: hypothetical protein ACO1N9_12060 [Flavobacterium sp.]